VSRSAKIGLVLGGYALAAALAAAVVMLHQALAEGGAADASAGMHAFGDALLFLATFALGAVPPTLAGALFLFRARPR
jgi:hypothetical protein